MERWEVSATRPCPTRFPFPEKQRAGAYVVSLDVGSRNLGLASVRVSHEIMALLRDRPWEHKEYHDADSHAAAAAWFVCSPNLAYHVVDSENVDMLEDNESKSTSVKKVSITKLEEFFRCTMLSRRETYLHPPSRAHTTGGTGGLGVPDAVVVETQPGYADKKVGQLYSAMYGMMDLHYDTMWRCGAVNRIPRLVNDSGRTKGQMAGLVENSFLSAYTRWMRHECDPRDFALWIATEHPTWMKDQGTTFVDRVLDDAAEQCLKSRPPNMDEFRTMLSASFMEEAKDRIARQPEWLRQLEQRELDRLQRRNRGGSKTRGGGGGNGKKPAPRSHREFVASVFEDDTAEIIYLEEPREDTFLQNAGDGGKEVNRYISSSSLPNRMKTVKRKRADRKERREWNKVKVVSAVEVLIEKRGLGDGQPWKAKWDTLRIESTAEVRNKRRDMADAILQGVGVLWKMVYDKRKQGSEQRRKRPRPAEPTCRYSVSGETEQMSPTLT